MLGWCFIFKHSNQYPMNYIIYFISLSLLAIASCNLQGQTLTARGGLNISTIQLKNSVEENFYGSVTHSPDINEVYGFHVGIQFENKFRNVKIFGIPQTYLSFKTGVILNQKGYKLSDYDRKLYYADIPALISMGYKKKKLRLNISAGFYFGKGLWGKYISYHDNGETSSGDIKFGNRGPNKIDYGYCLGVECSYQRFSVATYLYHGLSNVSSAIRYYDVYLNVSNQLLEISIGYRILKF